MRMRAELLAFQDDKVILANDSVFIAEESTIKSIELEIKSSRSWIWYVIIFDALPSLGMTIGLDNDDALYMAAAWGFTGLTAIAFYTSEPQVAFVFPLSSHNRETLRAHSRYPYHLAQEQIQKIR